MGRVACTWHRWPTKNPSRLKKRDQPEDSAAYHDVLKWEAKTAATGGTIARDELKQKLGDIRYKLSGDRDYGPARAKLDGMAGNTLAGIGSSVAGVTLLRLVAVGELDDALDAHRMSGISSTLCTDAFSALECIVCLQEFL